MEPPLLPASDKPNLPELPDRPYEPLPPRGYGSGMRKAYVFFGGAAYGVLMRLVFGLSLFSFMSPSAANSAASGVMMWSFVVLVPLVIGALTVYYSGGRQRTLAYGIVAPWVPILLFIAGTALLLIEGSICIAMAAPIFLLVGSIGGVVMWAVLKWFRPSAALMPSLLLLPFLSAALEGGRPMPALLATSDASITIAAKPEVLWRLINDARAIQPQEMGNGLAWRIGVPYPQSAVTLSTPQGRVRKVAWDRGVRFEEPITDWQENRYIRWNYAFGPGSIPAGALDEHVAIGGRYFDLIDTSYRLTPVGNGTRMDIHVTYRVTTAFNWYAGPAGRLMVDDAARGILAFYKHRAEAGGAR